MGPKAADSMRVFNQVEQPLGHLIEPRFINRVNAIALGKERMGSILACYFDRTARLNAASNFGLPRTRFYLNP